MKYSHVQSLRSRLRRALEPLHPELAQRCGALRRGGVPEQELWARVAGARGWEPPCLGAAAEVAADWAQRLGRQGAHASDPEWRGRLWFAALLRLSLEAPPSAGSLSGGSTTLRLACEGMEDLLWEDAHAPLRSARSEVASLPRSERSLPPERASIPDRAFPERATPASPLPFRATPFRATPDRATPRPPSPAMSPRSPAEGYLRDDFLSRVPSIPVEPLRPRAGMVVDL